VYKLTDFGAARQLPEDGEFMSLYGTEEYLVSLPLVRFVADLLYNKQYNKSTASRTLDSKMGVKSTLQKKSYNKLYGRIQTKLECGPMPNVMAALPNIGGALCSTPQSLTDAHYLTAV